MAGKREIKTTLALDGEQKFKKGMSDAASAIKELNSEQKLAEAQFEATGDAEQYAAEMTRILKSKIEEQRKAVSEAEKAIKQMKEDGLDPNSQAMQKWRTKLNNAKTYLVNLENQLDKTESELVEQGEALDNASTDAGEYKDAMEKAAQAVDFTASIQAINNVRDRIADIITTAGRAAKAMINLERGAAGWADELATNAAVAGLSVEDYQAWQYASQLIDSSVDSIRGAYKRLNKNLDEPTDDILKSLNELSVANLEVGGSARDTMDVFWDVIDALGQVENTSRRDQLATELLGKSYDELLPLINEGSEAYKALVEEGKEKAVSEESIQKLTDLDDTMVKLQATFDQTKYELLAQLAPAFQAAAEAATEALGAFNEFLDSEEGQAALNELKDAIGDMAEEFKNTDWQQQMSRVRGLVSGIVKALAWLIDHSDAVVTAIGGLAGVWAGLTVSKDVLSVLQLLNTIKWAQITKAAASSAGNAGAAAAGKAAANAATGAAAGKAGDFINKAGTAITSALKMASGPAAGLAIGSLVNSLANRRATERNWGGFWEAEEKLPELLAESRQDEGGRRYQEMLRAFQAAWEQYDADKSNLDVEDATAGIKDAFKTYANDLLQAAPDLGIWDWADYFGDKSDGLDDAEIRAILNNALNADNWINLGRDAVEKLAEGLESGESLPVAAADNLAADTEAAVDSIESETVGYNVGSGLAGGIYESIPLAVGAAEAMGEAVSGAMRRVLMVQSPSKVMERIGRYVDMGFAKGIEENVGSVVRATGRMAQAATGGAMNARPKGSAGRDAGGELVHVTLVLDGKVVGETITPYVDGAMAAQVSRRR